VRRTGVGAAWAGGAAVRAAPLGAAAGAAGVSGAFAAGLAGAAGRRVDEPVTGLSVGIGSGGSSGFSGGAAVAVAAAGAAVLVAAAFCDAAAGLLAVWEPADALARGAASTLRTRSAMWSGTTLSWFLASKTPPRRSLKSEIRSFDERPTSFASSKIRTFPVAKFCLSRCRLRRFLRALGSEGACNYPRPTGCALPELSMLAPIPAPTPRFSREARRGYAFVDLHMVWFEHQVNSIRMPT